MQLFYSDIINSDNNQFTFDKVESKHIVRVFRKKEDDILFITNGKGVLFKVKVLIANDKKCLCEILSVEKKEREHNYYLHIAIAPTKNNDRLEWFLEKATEIGIDEITPIICKHSERKVIKKERLEKVVISAMKQSLKFHLPKLNDAIPFKEFIQKSNSGQQFIAHCEESDKKSLKQELILNTDTTILIGPEGDFSSEEIEKALAKNFTPVSMGTSRLRTETAGVVAAHTIALLNE